MRRIIFTAALALFAAGCASSMELRLRVLSPAAERAWGGVEEDAYRGASSVSDSAAVATLGDAVRTGSCDEAGRVGEVVWPVVEALAAIGIEAQQLSGEIGPGGAALKAERLNQFGQALEACRGEPTDPQGEE